MYVYCEWDSIQSIQYNNALHTQVIDLVNVYE